jgi:GT2 family glycosyltransferase
MTINVIVVNWNSSDALGRCLASIAKSDFPSFRVIVVDNASEPSELQLLALLEKGYENSPFFFVRNRENHGYAGGNNAGLRYIIDHNLDGDILIVNPDVEIQSDTLSALTSAAVGDVGIVVPRIVDPANKVLFDRIILRGYSQRPVVHSELVKVPTDIAQGSCLLIRRCVADSVGLFDERFFLYWEEVDLSLRAKAAGFRLLAVNGTTVKKAPNAPTRIPSCFYYSVRNANLIRKLHPFHFSFGGYVLYTLRIWMLCFKFIGHARLFYEAWTSVALGLRDGITGRYGVRKSA